MLTTLQLDHLAAAGSVPPPAQLPLIRALYPPRRRGYRKRGRFLHYPEERWGVKLFPSDGYSAVALGRC